MKINKIAGICKPARLIKLYDEPDGSDVQWCGTKAVIYPLYSLPVLDSDTVGPVMSITDKEMKKIVVEHESIPDYYDISDNAVGEKLLNGSLIRVVIGSTTYNAYRRPGESGLLFINADYLKPLLGGEDDPELYLREGGLTGEYIAAKLGLMLAAIIEPEKALINERNADTADAFAQAMQDELARIENIPTTDPETGEIV